MPHSTFESPFSVSAHARAVTDFGHGVEQWWPKLKPSTRDWLVENNGDAVPAEVVVEITEAGGSVASDAWWVGEIGPPDFYFSDEATDWIEAVANGETPEAH